MKTIKAFSLSPEVIEAIQNHPGKSDSLKVEVILRQFFDLPEANNQKANREQKPNKVKNPTKKTIPNKPEPNKVSIPNNIQVIDSKPINLGKLPREPIRTPVGFKQAHHEPARLRPSQSPQRMRSSTRSHKSAIHSSTIYAVRNFIGSAKEASDY